MNNNSEEILPHPPEFDPSKCREIEELINQHNRVRPSKADSNRHLATQEAIDNDWFYAMRREQIFYRAIFNEINL